MSISLTPNCLNLVKMSKLVTLRAFVNQRLTAAAEDIIGLLERTIEEYEEELDRYRRLLRDTDSELRNNEPACPVKEFVEDPPEQQDGNPSLDQEGPPEPKHIKEEQQEVWTRQEEADITFTVTPAAVKREEEEKPQSSQPLHRLSQRIETAAAGQDCGGPEPDRNFNPVGHLAANKTSHSTETEDGDSLLRVRREPPSGLKNSCIPVIDAGCDEAVKSLSFGDCAERFGSKDRLQIHMKGQTEKTFVCPFCGKKFTKSSNLTTHLRVHTGEKPFTCSVCNTSFSLRWTLVNHMRVHTGEKPFSCSVCSKRFSKKANLTTHMALHTKEKPFKCAVCDKRFTWHSQVKNHKCVVDGGR